MAGIPVYVFMKWRQSREDIYVPISPAPRAATQPLPSSRPAASPSTTDRKERDNHAQGHHHGRRRARLPRLQHGVPRRPRRRGRRLHGGADPRASTTAYIRPRWRGRGIPHGIPIRPESELVDLIQPHHVDEVVLAYSDLSHEDVMHKASIVMAAGADFRLIGPQATMLRSTKPVVAVCAVRTGCGKSQTSRRVGQLLIDAGLKVALVRHPMPYGDLEAMRVQRFATLADIDASDPTVEEREEYEAPVELGMIMYAGVDYADILAQAQDEADVVIWDGGNNDYPFFAPGPDDHRRRSAAGGPRAPLPPGRGQPADGRRHRDQQGRRRRARRRAAIERTSRTSTRPRPSSSPSRRSRWSPGPPGRQARARRRRRPDDHPRRHAVRRRHGGGARGRRGRIRRPPAVRGRIARRHVRASTRRSAGAAGDGLRRRPAPRPRADDQRDRLRLVVTGTPMELTRLISIDTLRSPRDLPLRRPARRPWRTCSRRSPSGPRPTRPSWR